MSYSDLIFYHFYTSSDELGSIRFVCPLDPYMLAE